MFFNTAAENRHAFAKLGGITALVALTDDVVLTGVNFVSEGLSTIVVLLLTPHHTPHTTGDSPTGEDAKKDPRIQLEAGRVVVMLSQEGRSGAVLLLLVLINLPAQPNYAMNCWRKIVVVC